jgi:hypothetical protein
MMQQSDQNQIDKDLAEARTGVVAAQQRTKSIGTTQAATWDRATVLTLSTSLLIFAIIVLGLMTFLIMRTRRVEPILRAFGVPLIITAAVFLVVTGFSNQQISPVVGLLGTLAGYLLGKTDDHHRSPQEEHQPPTPTKAIGG